MFKFSEQGHYNLYIPQNKSENMSIGILVDTAANRERRGKVRKGEQKSSKKGRKDETNHIYFLSQQKIS